MLLLENHVVNCLCARLSSLRRITIKIILQIILALALVPATSWAADSGVAVTVADSNQAASAAAQATAALDRYRKLFQDGVLSRVELEKKEAELQGKITTTDTKTDLPVQDELSKARAELTRRESELAQNAAWLSRDQELYQNGIISRMELAQTEAASQRAFAAVEAARALVARVEGRLALAEAEVLAAQARASAETKTARPKSPVQQPRAVKAKIQTSKVTKKIHGQLVMAGYKGDFAGDLAKVLHTTGAVVTSMFRPGAVVRGKGVASMHSIRGGAIDIQGPNPELIAKLLRVFGWKVIIEYPGHPQASSNNKAPIIHAEFRRITVPKIAPKHISI